MNTEVTKTPTVPAEAALNELAAEAKTAEEQRQLAEWRAEIAQERTEAVRNLGSGAVERLVLLPGGGVTTMGEVERARESGDGQVGPYSNGRRA